jgi:hypothetical protein
VLTFYAFPAEHWPKIRSTNPRERFNREIARRTDVVGIFPDDPSLIRPVSMLAIEGNDEWLVGRSYISQKSMATLSDRESEKDLSHDQDKESSSSRPEPPRSSPTKACDHRRASARVDVGGVDRPRAIRVTACTPAFATLA